MDISTTQAAASANFFETNYIGMDLHLDNVVVSVCRNEVFGSNIRGREIFSQKFKTIGKPNITALLEALEPFCNNVPHYAVVESTYNWYWLADAFEERGWNLRLADPCTVSKANLKAADDFTDAAYLAECVRNGSLRTAQIMPKDERAVRDLCRYRSTVIEDRGRLKTILVNMVTNHLSLKIKTDKFISEINDAVDIRGDVPFEAVADQVLAGYFDSEVTRVKVRSLLQRIRFLTKEIENLDAMLADLIKPNAYAQALQTIRGCGFVTSSIIALEVGDIARFRTHKDFVSYCRLAPTSKLSNGKSKGLGNAKNGNAYLSWAFTELANFVVRFNKEAKALYDRYYNRSRLRVKAIRAIAAKLARAVFMMLKNGEAFNLKRCFGI